MAVPPRLYGGTERIVAHLTTLGWRLGTGRLSTSLDPECFRETARLARKREILVRPAEQNRRDSGNDHFRSALGTRPRRAFFGW